MKPVIAVGILGLSVLLAACAATCPTLPTAASADAAAAKHNAEGIEHFNMGHWDVAKGHFEAAIKADPQLAEPHFNLALALHNLGSHQEATTHFKKAAELAPGNRTITDSRTFRYHMGSGSPGPVGMGY